MPDLLERPPVVPEAPEPEYLPGDPISLILDSLWRPLRRHRPRVLRIAKPFPYDVPELVGGHTEDLLIGQVRIGGSWKTDRVHAMICMGELTPLLGVVAIGERTE